MSMRRSIAAVLIAIMMFAGQASAGVLYLSTSATNPSPGVPEIYLHPFGLGLPSSTTLYLWFELTTNEMVTGLAVDLVMDHPGHVVSTGSVTVPNPVVYGDVRWNPGKDNGSTGQANKLISGTRLFALSENGVNGSFGALDSTYRAGNSYRVAQVTVSALGMSFGHTNVWITTNTGGGISYANGQHVIGTDPDTGEPVYVMWDDPANTGFGSMFDPVNHRLVGITGATPDAIIRVIPEPTALSLLALGGLALRRRR